jgi:hypothetical protein
MDCSEIYKALFRYYDNYEYKLSNSYIYNWESDFFGMSKAGYFLEVEVKVSRNDYFRDFIKEKHRLFKDVMAKKTHTIERSPGQGDKICEYKTGKLISQYGEYARYLSVDHQWAYEKHNNKIGVWANDYGRVSMIHPNHEIYAEATRIHFREIAKIKCPNQLYFACPKDLIKVSEIPGYAGLLYYDRGIDLVKKAPYLHKVKQDMSAVLLSKFYNLWNYKLTIDRQVEISHKAKAL